MAIDTSGGEEGWVRVEEGGGVRRGEVGWGGDDLRR